MLEFFHALKTTSSSTFLNLIVCHNVRHIVVIGVTCFSSTQTESVPPNAFRESCSTAIRTHIWVACPRHHPQFHFAQSSRAQRLWHLSRVRRSQHSFLASILPHWTTRHFLDNRFWGPFYNLTTRSLLAEGQALGEYCIVKEEKQVRNIADAASKVEGLHSKFGIIQRRQTDC